MLSNNKNTLSPKQAIDSQTYSQSNNFSNNTVPPSQSAAYNPSNSQPAPPPQPALISIALQHLMQMVTISHCSQMNDQRHLNCLILQKIIGHKDPLVNDLPNLQNI